MPRARRTDPSSSHAAAASVARSGVVRAQCDKVLAALRLHPHRTSLELAIETGLDRHMVGRRLPGLRDEGLIQWSGETAKRKDIYTGRRSVTWWPAIKPIGDS